jgi:hypothetical protein
MVVDKRITKLLLIHNFEFVFEFDSSNWKFLPALYDRTMLIQVFFFDLLCGMCSVSISKMSTCMVSHFGSYFSLLSIQF